MALSEFFEIIKNYEENIDKVKKVEDMYEVALPDKLKGILSYVDKSLFIDDYRVLSFKDIFDAKDDLHVDFKEEGIIPVVDCMDNDFIVYDFKNNVWIMYNIVEKIKFGNSGELDEIMK